ncbi:MAG: AraC family transcriptional regulator [Chloroflexia bacterium]
MSSAAVPVAAGNTCLKSVDVAGFRVTDAVFPPLLTIPSHFHERTCVAVVLEGSIDKAFRNSAFVSMPSTVLTMPAEERHRDHFERAGAHMLVVEPGHHMLEQLRPCTGVLDRINHFRDGGVSALAWRISKELVEPDAVSSLAIEGLVLEMLATAGRRFITPPNEKRPPPWLSTVQELLHERFAEPMQVADVAAEVGVHPVHLARVFRTHFGESLGAYVRKLRLEWTAIQLTTADVTLCDLALQAGFVDQSHFTRAFKRQTGFTPAQYRTSVRR